MHWLLGERRFALGSRTAFARSLLHIAYIYRVVVFTQFSTSQHSCLSCDLLDFKPFGISSNLEHNLQFNSPLLDWLCSPRDGLVSPNCL